MFAVAKTEQGVNETLVDVLRLSHHPHFYVCDDLFRSSQITVYEQNLTEMKDTIPARFSQRMFDRFAPFLGAALRSYPQPISIDSTLSPRTVQRCVEEAIRAKREYGHKNPSLSESEWKQYHANLGTAEIDGRVWVGAREQLKRQVVVQVGSVAPTVPEHSVSANESALRALAQLLSSNALTPKPIFFVRGTEPCLRNILEKQYDIIFIPDEVDATKFYIT